MKWKTIFILIIIFSILYFSIYSYSKQFFENLIQEVQYNIPRLQEGFSQTMQDTMSEFGSYNTSLKEWPSTSQSDHFNKCINDVCNLKMKKCIELTNRSNCEYNYKLCRQDCGWDTTINTSK